MPCGLLVAPLRLGWLTSQEQLVRQTLGQVCDAVGGVIGGPPDRCAGFERDTIEALAPRVVVYGARELNDLINAPSAMAFVRSVALAGPFELFGTELPNGFKGAVASGLTRQNDNETVLGQRGETRCSDGAILLGRGDERRRANVEPRREDRQPAQ